MKLISKNKLQFLLLVVSTLALGIFLRVYKFNQVPISLYWDEIAIFVDAKSVAATGQDMHGNNWFQPIFPSYGDFKLPVYIWISSSFGYLAQLAHLAQNDWIVRTPNLLASFISFGVITWLGLELFASSMTKKQKQLMIFSTLLIISITPWSIMFSRTGFEAFMSQFFLTLSILLLFLSRKNKWLFIFLPITGLLATYTYFSTRFVWPLLFLFGYFLFFIVGTSWKKTRTKVQKNLRGVFLVILSLALFFWGISIMTNSRFYQASQQIRLSTDSILQNTPEIILSNEYRQQLGDSRIDRVLFHRYFLTGKELIKNYFDHLDLNYLFLTGELNLRHSTSKHGLFLISMLPLFLIGLYSLAKKQKKAFIFLLIWWFIALLPASVPETTPHALRSLNALTPLLLIISYGLYESLLSFKKKKIIQILIVSVLLINSLYFSHYYFAIYPESSAKDWQYQNKLIVDKVLSERRDKEEVFINKIDGTLYLWFMAYGDYSPEEYQQFEKKNFQINQFDGLIFKENLESDFIFPQRKGVGE